MIKELLNKNFKEFESLAVLSMAIDGFHSTWALAEKEWCINFLNKNPYFLFALGFKQSRTFKNNSDHQELINKFGTFRTNKYNQSEEISLFQDNRNEWFKIDWILDETTHDFPHSLCLKGIGDQKMLFKIPDFIDSVKNYQDNDQQKIIWSANNLISVETTSKIIGVETTTIDLINQIQGLNLILDNIRWQDLEDILAEIYKKQGFKVVKTQRTRDGGRDLIVSGELIPGMYLKMAVEITTQKYVDKDKVGKAILDNRNYPLIMIATTGRFSLGVKNLISSPDYQLRLKLADKTDILNWINNY